MDAAGTPPKHGTLRVPRSASPASEGRGFTRKSDDRSTGTVSLVNAGIIRSAGGSPENADGVNTAIGFKDALEVDDPRYVETARAERFGKHFFRTLGYDSVSDNFEPPLPGASKHVLFFGHVLHLLKHDALPAFERLGDIRSVAATQSRIAAILASRGQEKEALNILKDRALPVFKQLGEAAAQAAIESAIDSIQRLPAR